MEVYEILAHLPSMARTEAVQIFMIKCNGGQIDRVIWYFSGTLSSIVTG